MRWKREIFAVLRAFFAILLLLTNIANPVKRLRNYNFRSSTTQYHRYVPNCQRDSDGFFFALSPVFFVLLHFDLPFFYSLSLPQCVSFDDVWERQKERARETRSIALPSISFHFGCFLPWVFFFTSPLIGITAIRVWQWDSPSTTT